MTLLALRIKKIIITKPITYKAKRDSYKTNIESKGISALMYLLSLSFTDGEPETQKLGHLSSYTVNQEQNPGWMSDSA